MDAKRKQVGIMAKNKHYSPVGFSKRLKEVWLASGMTQGEVSRRIGYERKSISAWMNGDHVPSILALARLCKLFHVSADHLLFGEERTNGR